MVFTLYVRGNADNIKDMQQLADNLEAIARLVRQGNASDPTGESDFFVENDENQDEVIIEEGNA